MKYYTAKELAKILNVSPGSITTWSKQGKITRTKIGGKLLYSEEELSRILGEDRINVGYARVSTLDDEEELFEQKKKLELFMAKEGKQYRVITDIGLGINFENPGFAELMKMVIEKKVSCIYIEKPSVLLRFGQEIIKLTCRLNFTNIVAMTTEEDAEKQKSELWHDLLFVVKYYFNKIKRANRVFDDIALEKLRLFYGY